MVQIEQQLLNYIKYLLILPSLFSRYEFQMYYEHYL